MEKVDYKSIFQAIKDDNLIKFKASLFGDENLNISFGRFPILSVCYLFKSRSILKEYEEKLAKFNEFTKIEEPFELQQKFKHYAQRSLRFYINKTIYPIEMLAILDRRKELKKKYKLLFKNEEIINNIKKIYTLRDEIIVVNRAEILLPKKKMSYEIKKKLILTSSIVLSGFLFIGVVLIVIGNIFGLGTNLYPLKINNETQFVNAINKNLKSKLCEDLVFNEEIYTNKNKCSIDGNGHTITFNKQKNKALIENLKGYFKNCIINVNIEEDVGEDYSFLVKENNGKIEDVKFNVIIEKEINIVNNEQNLSIIALENNGKIKNCEINITANIKNNSSKDVYFSPYSKINNGEIVNSKVIGEINLETVDSSAFVRINKGAINNSLNKANITQSTNEKWNPTISAFVIENYGEIKDCVNSGKLSVNSLTEEDEVKLEILVGGITTFNFGDIKNSINSANIEIESKSAIVYAGGVTSINYSNINHSKFEGNIVANSLSGCYIGGITYANMYANINNVIYSPKIINSLCESEFNVSGETECFVAGICAYLYSPLAVIDKCGFSGKFNVKTSNALLVGGICSYNNFGSVSNSYSNIKDVVLNYAGNSCVGTISAYLSTNVANFGLFEYIFSPVTYYTQSSINNSYVRNATIVLAFNYSLNSAIGYEDSIFQVNAYSSYDDLPLDVKDIY